MLRSLDAGEARQFDRDGFLTFNPNLSVDEIASIRETLVRLHRRNVGFREGALFDAMSADDTNGPKRFPQIMHPRNYAPELMDTAFYRTAERIARQVLGPGARFKADLSLLKPADIGEATPWHQDEAFQDPAFDYNEVSFWLALQPVDESNSCMSYIPGSHRSEVLPHRFPGDDARIHSLDCGAAIDVREAVSCPLPAGGCVMHNQRTVHGAGPNVSSHDRLAYVLIFDCVPVPARMPRAFPWREQQHTARAQRELAWRRRGGLLVHLWRQRSRVRVTSLRTLLFDCRRAVMALTDLLRSWRRSRVGVRVR
ncbi:MAG: phytanoyl-CoA dioxygenase family protein [Proteobacteria bacterium]|nr:phytanoyl-CoA dioxygenase family protein [Pseudomonadota bacterium]